MGSQVLVEFFVSSKGGTDWGGHDGGIDVEHTHLSLETFESTFVDSFVVGKVCG